MGGSCASFPPLQVPCLVMGGSFSSSSAPCSRVLAAPNKERRRRDSTISTLSASARSDVNHHEDFLVVREEEEEEEEEPTHYRKTTAMKCEREEDVFDRLYHNWPRSEPQWKDPLQDLTCSRSFDDARPITPSSTRQCQYYEDAVSPTFVRLYRNEKRKEAVWKDPGRGRHKNSNRRRSLSPSHTRTRRKRAPLTATTSSTTPLSPCFDRLYHNEKRTENLWNDPRNHHSPAKKASTIGHHPALPLLESVDSGARYKRREKEKDTQLVSLRPRRDRVRPSSRSSSPKRTVNSRQQCRRDEETPKDHTTTTNTSLEDCARGKSPKPSIIPSVDLCVSGQPKQKNTCSRSSRAVRSLSPKRYRASDNDTKGTTTNQQFEIFERLYRNEKRSESLWKEPAPFSPIQSPKSVKKTIVPTVFDRLYLNEKRRPLTPKRPNNTTNHHHDASQSTSLPRSASQQPHKQQQEDLSPALWTANGVDGESTISSDSHATSSKPTIKCTNTITNFNSPPPPTSNSLHIPNYHNPQSHSFQGFTQSLHRPVDAEALSKSALNRTAESCSSALQESSIPLHHLAATNTTRNPEGKHSTPLLASAAGVVGSPRSRLEKAILFLQQQVAKHQQEAAGDINAAKGEPPSSSTAADSMGNNYTVAETPANLSYADTEVAQSLSASYEHCVAFWGTTTHSSSNEQPSKAGSESSARRLSCENATSACVREKDCLSPASSNTKLTNTNHMTTAAALSSDNPDSGVYKHCMAFWGRPRASSSCEQATSNAPTEGPICEGTRSRGRDDNASTMFFNDKIVEVGHKGTVSSREANPGQAKIDDSELDEDECFDKGPARNRNDSTTPGAASSPDDDRAAPVPASPVNSENDSLGQSASHGVEQSAVSLDSSVSRNRNNVNEKNEVFLIAPEIVRKQHGGHQVVADIMQTYVHQAVPGFQAAILSSVQASDATTNEEDTIDPDPNRGATIQSTPYSIFDWWVAPFQDGVGRPESQITLNSSRLGVARSTDSSSKRLSVPAASFLFPQPPISACLGWLFLQGPKSHDW